VTVTPSTHERRAQKSRTREAILAAARELLAEGQAVTLNAAARRAGVSRATAYRYFSDPSVLAAEAGLALEVRSYETITRGCAGTRERLVAIAIYFFDLALEHEVEFRAFLSRWLDAWRPAEQTVSRGARRVAMFERALDEGPERLAPAQREALVRSLTVNTGTEAMIALLDVARADREAARQCVAETAVVLIDRYLP
jgi:AcrR family transcriptional regulator